MMTFVAGEGGDNGESSLCTSCFIAASSSGHFHVSPPSDDLPRYRQRAAAVGDISNKQG